MSQLDTSEIKKKILQEIKKTEEAIAEYKDHTQPVAPENSIGRISRIDAIQNKSITEAALREAERKLAKLKDALSKVGEKDFGICAKCKQPIPLGRILLVPQSRYCVRCAS